MARAFGRFYSVILLLGVWELVARLGFVPKLLMPDLEDIGWQLWRFAATGDLLYHASATLERAMIGFAGGVLSGIALGTLLARLRWFGKAVGPLFSFGYPVPKVTFYPILIYLLGLGDLSKIALVFLECLYPVTLYTLSGMRSAQRVHLWAGRNMGANPRQLFWRVLVPSAAPTIFAGIRIALPVSLVVTIIAEIVGGSRGLGYIVAFQSASFEYASALAAIIVIGVIGFAFDRLVIGLRRIVIHWHEEQVSLT